MMLVGRLMARLSIRIKIIAAVAALLGLVCGVGFIYFPAHEEAVLTKAFLEKSRVIAGIGSIAMESVFSSKDDQIVDRAVKRIAEQPEVQYVVARASAGRIRGSFNLAMAESLAYTDLNHSDRSIHKEVVPIVVKEREVGSLCLGFSTADVVSRVERYRAAVKTVALILFFGGLISVAVAALAGTRRLRAVVETAERAAGGDLGGRAEVTSSKDEAGRLATALNAILMNAESAFKRLESLNIAFARRDDQLKSEIKQRKIIEKQVQLTDEIVNKANVLILVNDGDGKIEYASPSFEHILGYKPDDLLEEGWWKVARADIIERMRERKLTAQYARRERRVDPHPYEQENIDARGNHRWILWQDTRGLNDTLIRVGQDITERKLAEEQIREQAALLDITGDAIMVRNLDHRILYWNRGAEKLYGQNALDAVGSLAEELFQHEHLSGVGIAYTSVIENGSWSGEMQQVTRSGRQLTVESRWTLMNSDNGKSRSILVVNTDVTEQRQLESQFRRAQRLENIGTLAGGIAHDLNNVLTPILMSIQALQRFHRDEKTQQLLSMIETSARRGAGIVKQVLTFARGTEGERTLLQPKHIFREVEKIVRETFPRSIEIRFDLPSNLWTITGDATQLHQIVLNLLVNARDAMPNGGALTLTVWNITLDEESARGHLQAKAGNYVVLSVKDTGTGIAPEHLEKIFDPFFTTKEVGKGTGLGLSTVMAIVKSYGGFMSVASEPGKGTEFKVFIPATNADFAHHTEEGRQQLPSGRGESILVVDDELSIREIIKETLEAYGYQVRTAKDGVEALTLIEQNRRKYSLVLTDMMMPNMDGSSLIRTLERLTPDIKIIAVSGITDQDSLERLKKSRIEAFIPKPIQTDGLLKMLDSVLHSEN